MEKPRPFLLKALIVAAVLYVVGTCLLINDLYVKVSDLEHEAMHKEMSMDSHAPTVEH
jgi:hypothetical protein